MEWNCLDSFYPALMANSRAGGKTWGIPFQRSTILLYWNKALFKEAGLDPNRPPADWTEMADYAKKLTRRDSAGNVVQWGLQIPSSGFPYWLFQGLTTANGLELMNAAGTETRFDQPAAVCSSARAGGGTVTWPIGKASSVASSRARVRAQYLGASSR